MTARIGIVLFPGSNRDIDAVNARHDRGRRAGDPVARGGRPRRASPGVLLPGGFAYGDYLRAGRHRPLQPGHARRRRVRRPRRAGARDLQRVPGPGRGGSRPGCAAAQPRAAVRVPRGHAAAASTSTRPFTRELDGRPLRMPVAHGEGCYYADERALDAPRARRTRPVALRGPRRRRGRARRPRQPQRVAARDRGRPQRRGQRRRAHAPSRDRLRGDPRLGRWPGHHPLVRRERRRVGHDRIDPRRVGSGRRARRSPEPRVDRRPPPPRCTGPSGSRTSSSTRSARSWAATRTTSSSPCSA